MYSINPENFPALPAIWHDESGAFRRRFLVQEDQAVRTITAEKRKNPRASRQVPV